MLSDRNHLNPRFQLDALDGLRGMAMLLVFMSHASMGAMYFIPGLDLIGNGRAGVYLFFVLSAFLLTYPFLTLSRESLSRAFFINYALRRFLRIFPLYTLCLIVSFLSTFVLWKIFDTEKPFGLPITLDLQEFIAHLTLQQGKGITWSIVVEFHYYLVLPFVALSYNLLLRNHVGYCALLTVALIALCQWLWPQSEALPADIRLGPYLPLFFMGSLLAVVHKAWVESDKPASTIKQHIVTLAGLIAFAGTICMIPKVTSTLTGGEVARDAFHNSFILYAVLWSIVLFASIHGGGLLKWLFELPVLRYLGFISFSMYLLHFSVLRIIFEKVSIQSQVDAWLALGISVAISHITWVLIEKPPSKIRYQPRSAAGSTQQRE